MKSRLLFVERRFRRIDIILGSWSGSEFLATDKRPKVRESKSKGYPQVKKKKVKG